MARSQVTLAATALARAGRRPARLVEVVAKPGRRPRRPRPASGATTSPVRAVVDDLERPAGVGRRDDRLLGEERLVRDHPEVLVDGRVVDGEAARVEVGELVVADAAGERGAAVEAALARERLEPLAVGPVARDHDAQRRVERGRLEQQVDPLRAVEPVDREDEVAVAVGAVRQLLRRLRQHLGLEPGRALEPVGDVAGDREEPPRLAERDPVEPLDRAPQRPVLRVLRRTAPARCGRARRPGGTGARARRPCSGGGRRRRGTSSRPRGRRAAVRLVRSSSRQRNAWSGRGRPDTT